jgi:glycosyltransferase involved in cell wall biosynthesis
MTEGASRGPPGASAGGTRVLLVVEQLNRRVPGGIGTSIRGLLEGLRRISSAAEGHGDEHTDGADVTLFASRLPRRLRGSVGLPDAAFKVQRSSLPGPVLTRAWDHGRLRAPGGYDVVHATSIAAPPVRDARGLVTVHDLTWREVPEAFLARHRRWHEHALSRVIGSGKVLVVPSEQVSDSLLDAGARVGDVKVIPFGSDHLPPPDARATDELLASLGVGGEFLLSVGTLEPRKNLGRLFEAYAKARRKLPEPWPLLAVGPAGWGPDVPRVEGVVLAGAQRPEVLASLYQRARLLAYVPLAEGFGFPPLEAMRAGTPVVASRVPSSLGAVHEVDPRDVEQISEGLVELATSEQLRGRLIEEGRAHVARLDWVSCARRHLELWRSLR